MADRSHPVSSARPSNRACGCPAYSFPTSFAVVPLPPTPNLPHAHPRTPYKPTPTPTSNTTTNTQLDPEAPCPNVPSTMLCSRRKARSHLHIDLLRHRSPDTHLTLSIAVLDEPETRLVEVHPS